MVHETPPNLGKSSNGAHALCSSSCSKRTFLENRNESNLLQSAPRGHFSKMEKFSEFIRVRYYGAFAKMNASFFSFLPAQREKSCVSRLYFLPQNKKVNTDETAAPHSTLLSLFLLLFFNSFSYRSIVCVLSNCSAELSN